MQNIVPFRIIYIFSKFYTLKRYVFREFLRRFIKPTDEMLFFILHYSISLHVLLILILLHCQP